MKINEVFFFRNLRVEEGLGVELTAYGSEMMKEAAWRHLHYMTHIAGLGLTHSNWRHNLGHA